MVIQDVTEGRKHFAMQEAKPQQPPNTTGLPPPPPCESNTKIPKFDGKNTYCCSDKWLCSRATREDTSSRSKAKQSSIELL